METRPHPDFPEPKIQRVTIGTMFKSVLAILNLEKGIFYTAWEMIKSPGDAMRRYLFEDRNKFIEPLKFLVLTIPVYIFLSMTFYPEASFFAGIEEGFARNNDEAMDTGKKEQMRLLLEYIKEYSNLLLLLTVPIGAIWTYILFYRYKLSFGEHLVLNAFLYGFLTLVTIILLPLNWWSSTITGYIVIALNIGYITYFVKDFFRKSWGRAIFSSLVLTSLSFVTSFIGLTVVVILFAIVIQIF